MKTLLLTLLLLGSLNSFRTNPTSWNTMTCLRLNQFLNGTIDLPIGQSFARSYLAEQALNIPQNSTAHTASYSEIPKPPQRNKSVSNTTGSIAKPKEASTTAIPRCPNDENSDWLAYCESVLPGFDCYNANADTKAGIMKNMQEIRGCKYGN